MGKLIEGRWHDVWYDTKSTGGRFERSDAVFRNWVTADGSAGPSGDGGFKAEKGRYHLYVSYACPWAHRALIFRKLKGLEDQISLSVVHPLMLEQGWSFQPWSGVIPDPLHDAKYLHQVYTAAVPDFTGRVTVPVLWDRKTARIVSNESSEIIRMFNSAFDAVGAQAGDYYPKDLQSEIDFVNERVYHDVNNGVYKAGFATKQEVYEEAAGKLFAALEWLEKRLETTDYIVGNTLTEADIRLFTTLIRFDAVYHGHFKCNLKRIVDFPNLSAFTKRIYHHRGVSETVHFDHIKTHYYGSHKSINPTGIVPLGPAMMW